MNLTLIHDARNANKILVGIYFLNWHDMLKLSVCYFQVFNAVDAGATLIAVRINFKFHKIQVIDNGCGMNSAHLDLVGTR